jgi:hypothetical protein
VVALVAYRVGDGGPPMNAPIKVIIPGGGVKSPKENAEFALDLMRIVIRRLKEIDQEVTALGTALAQGRMPPDIALKLVEQIAPGCIDKIYLSLYEGVSPEQLRDDLASNGLEAGGRK